MNKLLLRKVLALSVLALAVEEGLGMERPTYVPVPQEVRQYILQHNPLSKIQILDHYPDKEGKILIIDGSSACKLVNRLFVEKTGNCLNHNIVGTNIWGFMSQCFQESPKVTDCIMQYLYDHADEQNSLPSMKSICKNSQSMMRPNKAIPAFEAALTAPENYRLQGWTPEGSNAYKWIESKKLDGYRLKTWVNTLEHIISNNNINLTLSREAKRKKNAFLKFVDDNWEILEPLTENCVIIL